MKEKLKKLDKNKVIIISLIVLTIIRVLIGMQLPVGIFEEQMHDDALMHNYAFNLRSFHWLGSYNQLTLVKGITFPVFMALCNFLYIPYSMGLTLLYIFAVFCIIKALKPKFSNKTLVIMYILLLFTPSMFDQFISQRVYRNAILPSATLLVYAGFIGMFFRKDKPIKDNLFFILLSIFSLIFFWHIKEDSIWILPFTIVISILSVIYWIINDRKKIFTKILIILLPFISLFSFNRIYSYINYNVYGINVVSDKSNGNFSRMIKDMLLIEDKKNTDKNIWISSYMIDEIYEISPTFKELKPTMDEFDGWLEDNGEVRGDLVIWRIRTVMSMNNLYENAKKADDFSKKVADEIEDAFKNGKLKKDKRMHITSQMRGIDLDDIFDSMSLGHKWFYELGRYDRIGASNVRSTGVLSSVQDVQAFISSNIMYQDAHYEYGAVNKANKVVDIYKLFGMPVTILSLICFVLITIKVIIDIFKRKFADLDLYIVIVGIGLSIILLLTEVALFTLFFDKQTLMYFRNFYCASAFPLMHLFKYMTISLGLKYIYEYIKDTKLLKRRNLNGK